MNDQTHYLASDVLRDMKGFGWPLVAVAVLRLLPSTLAADREDMKRALFILEAALLFFACFFLVVDGGAIFSLALQNPLWGMTFALGLAATFASFLLHKLQSNRDSAALAKGIFEVPLETQESFLTNPKAYSGAALCLLVASAIWLFAL